MATDSTIMDSNSFKMSDIDKLTPELKAMVKRREILGEAYRLFYKEPLDFEEGHGTKLYTPDGTEYLDAYNNIPSLGHSRKEIQEAVSKQLTKINTHTRYLNQNILNYAEDLLATFPEELNRVMFMLSGSEANDLAVRVAKAATGGEGIIVTAEAYHGNTDLITRLSPSIGSDVPMDIAMRMIPTPDTYRLGTDDLGDWMAEQVEEQIADMKRHGIKFAGIMLDSIFSSDGIFPGKKGLLKPVIDMVHKHGGIYIADEVQPGFGRTGETFWGFQRHGIVPDLVTMGKPMANGIACSALVAKADLLKEFSKTTPYFNTFGGSPVAMAAAQATLNTMKKDNTQENSLERGKELVSKISDLAKKYPVLGDVRGAGLYVGVDIVKPGTKDADYNYAVRLIETMRENHVLLSLCGPYGNVLKIRPPLVFSKEDVIRFTEMLEKSLNEMEEEKE
ncbi:aspartate aminotransferase family protein [Ligilactobacillus sp. WILCCON 0076]|uniref:Aspartate aminotransferase family protein n=1 Tax=Ligilactobacillus ubinensis TaxID=2876789 RepID=A0A9X2FMA4_9LACO|nr:aspartate aminotransferase family protein [Ligilactobacillus ubinensis]MCP0887830.1 aspartate aminotransferase family protein [Ligilactobacillus ubinensis]